jgi:hypothetical protein
MHAIIIIAACNQHDGKYFTLAADCATRETLTAFSFYIQPCDIDSDEEVVCEWPAIDIPSILLPLLDSKPYAQQDIGKTDYNFSCPQYVDDPQQLSPVSNVVFSIGFIFDGYRAYNYYENVDVYPPPIICFNSSFLWLKLDMLIPVGTRQVCCAWFRTGLTLLC